MIRSDDEALAVADKFCSAALGTTTWYSALQDLAAATGSKSGQLISIGANGVVPIDILTDMDPSFHEVFVAAGGGDPNVNPRVKAGMEAPILKVLAENDFLTHEEHKTHPHYRRFAHPWDVPYICLATLERSAGMLVGLAVVRSKREGHITSEQRRVFGTLAPHVRAAVRMQMALENQAAALLTGAMEALSAAAFVCAADGRVLSQTPAAEAIVAGWHGLQLKANQLSAANDVDAKALSDAIARSAQTSNLHWRAPATVFVRATTAGAPPLVLDVLALPARALEFSLEPQALVVVQGANGAESRRRAILQTVYNLTAAETDVAMQLSIGRTPDAIAAARGVTIATIRAQIKCVLAKVGVTRQVELVARVGQL